MQSLMKPSKRPWYGCVCALLAAAVSTTAQTSMKEGKELVDFGRNGTEKQLAVNGPDNGECTYRILRNKGRAALEVTARKGKNAYPGITIRPGGDRWDLSAYGRVEADVTNLGGSGITVALRVDNPGDWRKNPWNSENTRIPPGQTVTAKVVFGYSWGKRGYDLDPAKVNAVLLFAVRQPGDIRFRVDAVRVAGKPGEKPDGVVDHIRPKDGVIFDPTRAEAVSLLQPRGLKCTTVATESGRCAEISFDPGRKRKWPGVFFGAPKGVVWDLGDFMQVGFAVGNPGRTPVRVLCRVDNKGADGRRHCATGADIVAPGERKEISVSFVAETPWDGSRKGSGSQISSADVTGALVSIENPSSGTTIRVYGIQAGRPPLDLPEWLGKRPPVDGDWIATFGDDFEGAAIDKTRWNVSGPNYWDRKSHWSRYNALIGGGVVRLRYEKKHGFHNDDPDGKGLQNLTGQNESDYVCGYLDTEGKWTQRYGYFEARMKLPTAPGLWPAFWMMPDRGASVDPWKRHDTHDGGMEIDIMENLTRWGSSRYNIAVHWDGYKKDHKSIGDSKVYVQPDSGGFITCGLLWEPGMLVFYGNGKEVGRWKNPRVASVPTYMMFTVPQGGWDNDRVDDSGLPDDFVLDYVRAWQRKEWIRP